MMTNLVTGFDGRNYYPFVVISQTAKSALVQRTKHDGTPYGEQKRARFSKYYPNERVVDAGYSMTVYLDQPFDAQNAIDCLADY